MSFTLRLLHEGPILSNLTDYDVADLGGKRQPDGTILCMDAWLRACVYHFVDKKCVTPIPCPASHSGRALAAVKHASGDIEFHRGYLWAASVTVVPGHVVAIDSEYERLIDASGNKITIVFYSLAAWSAWVPTSGLYTFRYTPERFATSNNRFFTSCVGTPTTMTLMGYFDPNGRRVQLGHVTVSDYDYEHCSLTTGSPFTISFNSLTGWAKWVYENASVNPSGLYVEYSAFRVAALKEHGGMIVTRRDDGMLCVLTASAAFVNGHYVVPVGHAHVSSSYDCVDGILFATVTDWADYLVANPSILAAMSTASTVRQAEALRALNYVVIGGVWSKRYTLDNLWSAWVASANSVFACDSLEALSRGDIALRFSSVFYAFSGSHIWVSRSAADLRASLPAGRYATNLVGNDVVACGGWSDYVPGTHLTGWWCGQYIGVIEACVQHYRNTSGTVHTYTPVPGLADANLMRLVGGRGYRYSYDGSILQIALYLEQLTRPSSASMVSNNVADMFSAGSGHRDQFGDFRVLFAGVLLVDRVPNDFPRELCVSCPRGYLVFDSVSRWAKVVPATMPSCLWTDGRAAELTRVGVVFTRHGGSIFFGGR